METRRIRRGAVATVGMVGLATAGMGIHTAAPAGATTSNSPTLYCGLGQVHHNEPPGLSFVTGTNVCPGVTVQVRMRYKDQGTTRDTNWSTASTSVATQYIAAGPAQSAWIAIGCVRWASASGVQDIQYSGANNAWVGGCGIP